MDAEMVALAYLSPNKLKFIKVLEVYIPSMRMKKKFVVAIILNPMFPMATINGSHNDRYDIVKNILWWTMSVWLAPGPWHLHWTRPQGIIYKLYQNIRYTETEIKFVSLNDIETKGYLWA